MPPAVVASAQFLLKMNIAAVMAMPTANTTSIGSAPPVSKNRVTRENASTDSPMYMFMRASVSFPSLSRSRTNGRAKRHRATLTKWYAVASV